MKAIAPSRICNPWLTARATFARRSACRLTAPSAALLLMMTGSALAQPAPAAPPQNVEITEKARELFRTGVALVQDPEGARYEEAYQQFKAAYAESPSWKILGNLGYTAMKLERDGEAIDAFRGYLEQGGKDLSRAERDQFQSDLDTLSATAATVTILGLPPGTRVIDARSPNQGPDVKNHYEVPEGEALVLRVRPGAHHFSAQWGREPESRELDVAVRGAHEVKFGWEPAPVQPERQPEPVRPGPALAPATAISTSDEGFFQSPIPAYVSLGVGAVGVGLGVVFLVQRSSATSDANDRFDACLQSLDCVASDQQEMERLDDEAATMGTLSVVSFGVGALGLGAGAALLLLDGNTEEEAPTAAGVSVQPYATTNELGLWGRF